MTKWNEVANQAVINKTVKALKLNGMDVIVVNNSQEAKKEALKLLPAKAEIMSMTSTTLDGLGISKEINESGKYDSVRNKLMSMDRQTQGRDMQKLGAAPDHTIGSVQAITENGQIISVSNTGSQLPAYVYGANKVIWVVGVQKIVKNLDEAMKRIYEYVLPLESERAKKAYGVPASAVNKILLINKENIPGRITVILVKEALGY